MPSILPPGGPSDFNPWQSGHNPEFIPVEIASSDGSFTFNLPSYYAGAFEMLEGHSFEELKAELHEMLPEKEDEDSDSLFFSDTIICSEDMVVQSNNSAGNYLLFFTLENFSNPDLELTEAHRERIKKECADILFINEFPGPAKDINKANAYFLLFCKLLSIQDKVDKMPNSTPEHKELVDNMISAYMGSMDAVNNMSEICVLARKHFESLITSDIPKGIRTRLWKLVQPSEWNRRIQDFYIRFSDSRKEAIESDHISKDAKLIQQTFEKLTRLENAIKPNTNTKISAWEEPFKTVTSALEGKKNIVYVSNGPFKGNVNDANQQVTPNILKFQINFLRYAAEQGFKNWLFTGSFIAVIASIVENFRDTTDEMSLFELKEKIGNFLDLNKNQSEEDFRDFLGIDKEKKRRSSFRHAVNFISEIRKIVKEFNISLKVFQCENDDADIINGWMDSEDEKRLLFGDNLGIPMKETIFIMHSNPIEDNDEYFRITTGIAHKTKEVANQHGYGWGKDKTNSVCIPIEGNAELISMKDDEDLRIYEQVSIQACPYSDKNIDFIIITKEGESNDGGDDTVNTFDPSPTVKSSGPLVLV